MLPTLWRDLYLQDLCQPRAELFWSEPQGLPLNGAPRVGDRLRPPRSGAVLGRSLMQVPEESVRVPVDQHEGSNRKAVA